MWGSSSGWGHHDGGHQYPSTRRGGGGGYQASTSSTPPLNHYNNQFQNQNTGQHQQHHTNQNRNKNKRNQYPQRAKPKGSENYKIPSCPKCHRYFDLNARCPLILSCRHLMCEECVRSFPVGNNMKCYECDTLLNKRLPSNDVREVFDINYYVAGQIYYLKPHAPQITHNIAFQPAGMTTNQPVAGRRDFKEPTRTVKTLRSTLYVCAWNNCKSEAALRCVECDDTYCEKCSEILHNSAKGLKTHQIFPLTLSNCSAHKMIEEFYCVDCKNNYCSYCILAAHKQHIHKQITKLDETDMEEFKELHDSCKGVFKSLKSALSKADLSLNKNDPSNIQKSIHNSFAGLHANLQLIENNLLKKLTDSSDSSVQNLLRIRDDLLGNIQAVESLIIESQKIVDNKAPSKLNVSVLVERMRNASRLPCFFLEENSVKPLEKFEFDQFWKRIEDSFMPLTSCSKKFKLINENELPDDYRVSDFSETASHLSVSTKSVMSEISINKKNLTNCPTINKTQQIGMWIKETNNVKYVPKAKKKANSSGSSKSTKSGINQSITQGAFSDKIIQVIVTHLNNPSSIYVQIVKQRKTLENLHESLTAMVKNLQVGIVDEPKINNLYIVKNYDSKKPTWCRGKVIEIREEDRETSFEVFYIDFGNVAEVKRSDFRYITPELIKVQPLAVECKLNNVYPVTDDWNEEMNVLLLTLLKGDVVMHILKNEPNKSLEVDFMVYTEDSDYFIRDTLYFMGVAKTFDHEPSNPIAPPVQTRKEEVFSDIPQRLTPNTKYSVIITHVIDPHNFYVQLHSREQGRLLENLSKQMTDYYMEHKKNFIYNPKVGMGVALQCIAGGVLGWYRARITDVKMGSGEVEVILIDFGYTLCVSWKHIKKLNEHFATETQKMALNVRLAQIEPYGDKWNQESVAYLKQFVEEKELLDMIVHSTNTFMEVVLLKTSPGSITSINGEICGEGFAKSTGNLSSIVQWQDIDKEEREESFTTSMLRTVQGGENQDEDECEDLNFQHYKTIEVQVAHIESPACVYFNFTDEEKKKKLAKHHNELQTFCEENELTTKDDWKVGDFGVAKNQQDKQYYRVLIQEFDGEDYQVFSRDYAFHFKAALEDLSILSEEFCAPAFAYRCHFYGIKPVGKDWTLTATDYLKEILLQKKNVFFIRVGPAVELNSSKSTPGVFWYKLLKPGSALEPSQVKAYNVNLQLGKKGLAMKEKFWNLDHLKTTEKIIEKKKTTEGKKLDITRRNIKSDGRKGNWLNHPPITEENFKATITYIDECACIYFQSETGASLAESYQEEMEIFKNFQAPKKVTWEINDRCSVKYHQNDCWYRGIVVGFTDDDEIKVCMIDYGNVEEVTIDELRTEILFENEPVIAQKIQLHNIYPKNHKFSTSDIDLIHMHIVDKLATIEIIDFGQEPPTAIVKIDSLNINEFLLKTEGNYSNILPNVHDSCSKDDLDVLIEEDHSVEELQLPRVYRCKELPTDRFFNVNIINALAYNKVVFEITDRAETKEEKEAFENLSVEINEQAEFQPQLEEFEENTPCIALFDQDGQWYRGNIKNVKRPTINVHFVDFGNIEEVAERDVRVIKPEWLYFPLAQHTAILNEVETSNREKIKLIEEHVVTYYDQIKRCEIVSENPLVVNLYEENLMELSYAEFIDDDF